MRSQIWPRGDLSRSRETVALNAHCGRFIADYLQIASFSAGKSNEINIDRQ